MEVIKNKKAYFDYEILEQFEAGIMLHGYEVKAIRQHKIQLKGGYISIKNSEPWLENVQISPYQPKNQPPENGERKRKLLLNAKEIAKLEHHSNTPGITIIPLKIFEKNHRLKLVIGACRGKKKYDKREQIKKRDLDRGLKRMGKIR